MILALSAEVMMVTMCAIVCGSGLLAYGMFLIYEYYKSCNHIISRDEE